MPLRAPAMRWRPLRAVRAMLAFLPRNPDATRWKTRIPSCRSRPPSRRGVPDATCVEALLGIPEQHDRPFRASVTGDFGLNVTDFGVLRNERSQCRNRRSRQRNAAVCHCVGVAHFIQPHAGRGVDPIGRPNRAMDHLGSQVARRPGCRLGKSRRLVGGLRGGSA